MRTVQPPPTAKRVWPAWAYFFDQGDRSVFHPVVNRTFIARHETGAQIEPPRRIFARDIKFDAPARGPFDYIAKDRCSNPLRAHFGQQCDIDKSYRVIRLIEIETAN